MTNEYFGILLKIGIQAIAWRENKTMPAIQEELASKVGLTYHSIDSYKKGNIPSNDLIRILVVNSVTRGLQGKEWVKHILDAADYQFTYELIEELFPSNKEEKPKEKLNNNLPAPSYSQFVMRQAEFNQIITGIQQRSAIVLIRSFGGMGKTSLAREVAFRCISTQEEYAELPKFDTAIWISDANSPGLTNITIVLDEIARTLEHDDIVKLPFDEKLQKVNRILTNNKVLLIIDNFETIKDDFLLQWIGKLPELSKCIVTSREYHRAFRDSCIDIELGGMTYPEAHEFIGIKINDLGIEKLNFAIGDFDPLLNKCGGNPKAIEMALGIIKHSGRKLKDALEILVEIKGNLFKDLFKRTWDLLNEEGKEILTLMAMFPNGTDSKPLIDMLTLSDNDFQNAIEKLYDLSLLSIKGIRYNEERFYYLHPMVNAFANKKLEENISFEKTNRKKWLDK